MQLAKLKLASILILSVSLLTGATSCETTGPKLHWKAEPYISDSQTQSIVRKNGDSIDQVMCSSAEFDGRACYKIEELKSLKRELSRIYLQCEKWK